MEYYICATEQVIIDGQTITRPAIARHTDQWNTFGGYAATSVLVAVDPTPSQKAAIEADPDCDYMLTTRETSGSIAGKNPVTKTSISPSLIGQINSTLARRGLSFRVNAGVANADTAKNNVLAAMR